MGAAHLAELAEDEATLKSFGEALGSKGGLHAVRACCNFFSVFRWAIRCCATALEQCIEGEPFSYGANC